MTSQSLFLPETVLINRATMSSGVELDIITNQDVMIPDRESLLKYKHAVENCLNFTDEQIVDFNAATAARLYKRYQPQDSIPNPLRKKLVANGYVYLMQNLRNKFIKIGFSKNPSFREKTLQSQEPEVKLIYSHPGDMILEERIHMEFRHKRVRGEWFKLSKSDVRDVIFSLKSFHPTPEKPRSEAPTRKEGHPRNYPSGIREDRPEDDVEYDA